MTDEQKKQLIAILTDESIGVISFLQILSEASHGQAKREHTASVKVKVSKQKVAHATCAVFWEEIADNADRLLGAVV